MEGIDMAIKYRHDPDLEFLQHCENEDLKVLVDFLTTGKDKKPRWTERLSVEPRFKECGDKYNTIWDLITGEVQLFGADTIVSLARGRKGVLYHGILIRVAKRLRVNFNDKSPVDTIELNLLMKVVEKSLDKMSEEEKREFAKTMNLKVENLSAAVIMAALQTAVRVGGFEAYQLALVVANSIARALVGRGLSIAANAGLTRVIGIFAGPIGWGVTAILTVPMISGPAYRILVPATVQIAYMRQKYLQALNAKQEAERASRLH
jgi:uncharacterized protein YaaW (UPF0174 family)